MEIMSFTPPFLLSTLMFLLIYLLGYFIIFRNWTKKHRSEASSCLISLAHVTPALLLATHSIPLHTQIDIHTFSSPNTTFQDTILEYSTAYFLIDLLHYTGFTSSDVHFIAHHLAVLCHPHLPLRGSSWSSSNSRSFLAKTTSACQNTWTLSRYWKADLPWAAGLYKSLSPIFYGLYSVVRGVFGPIFVYKMWVFYGSGGGDGVIPRWAWVSWLVVILGGIMVTIMWVCCLWIDLFKERSKKRMR